MKVLQILLAEDNRADVILVRAALKHHAISYDLHLAADGVIALNFLATMGTPQGGPCPDLVLLDLNLPKIDGPELLHELRMRPECATTPVIVVSSSDSVKDRNKMASMGVARYFKKPSDYDEFMQLGQIIRDVVAEGA